VLNPDGVTRGQWRFDTNGVNLNREYFNPSEEDAPTILAAKNAILDDHEKGNLKMYVDFHAHASKKGCFIYGNSDSTNIDKTTETHMIPKLMSMNSVNFDMNSCNFEESENNVKDLRNECRSGSSRAIIGKLTDNNPLVYTLEANYTTGRRINVLQARYDKIREKRIYQEDSKVQDALSSLYGDIINNGEVMSSPSPWFSPPIWHDIGQSLLVALLDYDHINPISRLITAPEQDLGEAV